MAATLIEIDHLSTCFGRGPEQVNVVDDVSFKINRGQTFVLLGESGSGKSITALSIMRLLPAAARIKAGAVILNGQDLLQLPERRMRDIRGARIGMIFQEPQASLNPVLTAGQQIGEVLRRHKNQSGRGAGERAIELLEAVGIPEPARRIYDYPHQFSGGMKQRIMIAMALAAEPDLLIADEPTTALDVTIQAQVLALLKRLQKETGMALLFITHDLGVAAQMADQVAVMRHGRIVEQKDKPRLFARPEHPYTLQLFEALPGWDKRHAEPGPPAPERKAARRLLQVTDLKVHFPIRKGLFKRTVGQVRAVNGVSLNVHAGETVALVGESGSGKTTMAEGILRLLTPSGGRVHFQGQALDALDARALRQKRADLQIVFQDPYSSMNPRMMIRDVIQEGMLAQNIGADQAERDRITIELLQQVGLAAEHRHRYPHEFSGGQRQRICIARALAVKPRLIICDEPTSALDVSVQAQILALFRTLQHTYQLGYLFITHNISVVEYIAHHVAVMYQGEIVEQGPAEQVLKNPQNDYTKKLLSAVPRVEKIDR